MTPDRFRPGPFGRWALWLAASARSREGDEVSMPADEDGECIAGGEAEWSGEARDMGIDAADAPVVAVARLG